MSAEIGVAVIGFGLAGQVFHAPFVSAVPGLRLEAIVQRKGDEAAKAYPKTRILRSVDEALNDPAVQLIVVGTPNETHFDLTKQALLAGTGVGAWDSVEAACAATVRVAETIEPKNAAVMDEAYQRYRRIYPALREIARS